MRKVTAGAVALGFVVAFLGCKGSKHDESSEEDSRKEASREAKPGEAADNTGRPSDAYDSCPKEGGGYLTAAKTAEAKNTIGAIARGAIAAYEREQADWDGLEEGSTAAPTAAHALCKSATPVPDTVPRGEKYQPNTGEGHDYETGDATTGWKCLKFAMTRPHYYRYGYAAGSGYMGPKRGLRDPGPNGYEAWAEGDLDGDGRTSLYTCTGKVDQATGQLKMDTTLHCAAPGE